MLKKIDSIVGLPKSPKQILILLTILILMFVWGVSSHKFKVFPYNIMKALWSKTPNYQENINYDANKIWAKKVVSGGYILHFRHAQREKWTDVTGFDALELVNNLDASQSSFSRATCLTERGREEAKLINEIFELVGVKISKVITSPSCRARQTSLLAFGREGKIENSLLHRTAIMQSQHREFAIKLREVIDEIKVPKGSNVVLSGHGGTLGTDDDIVIDVLEKELGTYDDLDDRDEGGFIVLEKVNGKVIARHKFRNFSRFVNGIVQLKTSEE